MRWSLALYCGRKLTANLRWGLSASHFPKVFCSTTGNATEYRNVLYWQPHKKLLKSCSKPHFVSCSYARSSPASIQQLLTEVILMLFHCSSLLGKKKLLQFLNEACLWTSLVAFYHASLFSSSFRCSEMSAVDAMVHPVLMALVWIVLVDVQSGVIILCAPGFWCAARDFLMTFNNCIYLGGSAPSSCTWMQGRLWSCNRVDKAAPLLSYLDDGGLPNLPRHSVLSSDLLKEM